ncbi:MAG TPA: peptidylprolyl isomerase [Candidatus Cloacimonadota bacterium]|nr:peptidylprolyl isomerase [Candidatus Cloacimonadota bacterium]
MKRLIIPVLLLLIATALPALQFAKWHTSLGDFTCELYDDIVPITANNFITLTRSGFYNDLIFHRVVAGFVIQDGDPLGTGYGGPGYTIPDEFSPLLHHDQAGILAMAHTSQPNSAGSQYYITLAPTPNLDGNYAIFGKVIEGLEYVQLIGSVATNANGLPLLPVNIHTLSMVDLDIGNATPPLNEPVLTEAGTPQTFIIEVTTQNGGETYAWYIDDTIVPNQTDFIFESAFTSGNHTVKCRISQGSFHYDLTWNVQSGSANNDPHASPVLSGLSVYPNPFGDSTTLKFNLGDPTSLSLTVYDLRGRKLREETIPGRTGEQEWTWDGNDNNGNHLAPGKYFLSLRSGSQCKVAPVTLY